MYSIVAYMFSMIEYVYATIENMFATIKLKQMDTSLEKASDQAQNDALQKWGSMVQRKLRSNAGKFQHGKDVNVITKKDGYTEGKLKNSVYAKYHQSFGAIDAVTFGFAKHGVFVQKGVGRGHSISSGMVMTSANMDNQKAQIKKSREPQDWFNSEIIQSLPELADKLAEINADLVLNATKILIK
jgi:hypothetical protein